MDERPYRITLLAAFALNLAFFAVVLLDFELWTSHYLVPLVVAWALVVLVAVLLGVLGRPHTWTPTHSTERIYVQESATPALARAVATLAARPAQPSPVLASTPPRAPLLELKEEPFPFTYNGYTLYSRKVELKNGGARTIWFFSKRTPASGTMAAKPADFHVGVNERTGLPFLKKGRGPDGEDLTPHVEAALRPQCSALTEDGKQCRNSARHESKYCASHFGYQPPIIAKAEAIRKDTRARVRNAPDTIPSVRRKPTA